MRRVLGAILLSLVLATSGAQVAAAPDGSASSSAQVSRRVLGYYVPYDATSWVSLEQQAHLIDVLAAQWATIDACGRLTTQDNQTIKQFAKSRGMQILPSAASFSGWLAKRILTDPEASARALTEIVDYVVAEGYDGFDFDLEGVWPEDRAPYTAFVTRLAQALHDRGKILAIAIPSKTSDTTDGWAGAYDYAALGAQADLITIMSYDYHGPWSAPGPIAPYNWVEQTAAFATSQIPPEKVRLGIAFYGNNWNTTSGGSRYVGYPEAELLSQRYGAPIVLDPTHRSETLRYRAPTGEQPPAPPAVPALQHEITQRQPPACPITEPPAPTPTGPPATPRPTPQPGAMQDHEVWIEGPQSAEARLALADRVRAGGVATWRLGQEGPAMWAVFDRWRRGEL
jgi:spore germination protein YaaH